MTPLFTRKLTRGHELWKAACFGRKSRKLSSDPVSYDDVKPGRRKPLWFLKPTILMGQTFLWRAAFYVNDVFIESSHFGDTPLAYITSPALAAFTLAPKAGGTVITS